MEDLLTQLYKVPVDAWYAVFVLIGTIMYAIFTENHTVGQAIKGLLLGLFGGGVAVLLLTGFWSVSPRVMVAIAGLCGFFGNWLLHFLYNQREVAGGFLSTYLKKRYGGDNAPPHNPSQENNEP